MYRNYLKPLFDFIGALLLLPIVQLVVLVFAPIIWLTDRGPVFYNAPRMGKWHREFKMYKLRSMCVNAPDRRNADGSTVIFVVNKRHRAREMTIACQGKVLHVRLHRWHHWRH